MASPREVDEPRLIALSVAGDDDAFRQLIEPYYRPILKAAHRAFGSLPIAEDCTQDVFIKVHKNLHSFRGETPFRHWLYRVAANTVTDMVRRRRIDVPLDALLHETAAQSEDPAEAASLQEQRMMVRRAIADLPGRLRDAIVLQVFHELSYQEIADVLKIPIGTVMSRIHNARALLRGRLADYVSEPRALVEASKP